MAAFHQLTASWSSAQLYDGQGCLMCMCDASGNRKGTHAVEAPAVGLEGPAAILLWGLC